MDDLRPTFESPLGSFGLDAVVTPPGGPAVETRAVWLPTTTEDYPTAADQRRAEPRERLALPLDDVPQIPRGTVVTVPKCRGAVATNWKVDEVDRVDDDHYRVVVVLIP